MHHGVWEPLHCTNAGRVIADLPTDQCGKSSCSTYFPGWPGQRGPGALASISGALSIVPLHCCGNWVAQASLWLQSEGVCKLNNSSPPTWNFRAICLFDFPHISPGWSLESCCFSPGLLSDSVFPGSGQTLPSLPFLALVTCSLATSPWNSSFPVIIQLGQ